MRALLLSLSIAMFYVLLGLVTSSASKANDSITQAPPVVHMKHCKEDLIKKLSATEEYKAASVIIAGYVEPTGDYGNKNVVINKIYKDERGKLSVGDTVSVKFYMHGPHLADGYNYLIYGKESKIQSPPTFVASTGTKPIANEAQKKVERKKLLSMAKGDKELIFDGSLLDYEVVNRNQRDKRYRQATFKINEIFTSHSDLKVGR